MAWQFHPPFRDDQRAYLRAFNFEALLLLKHENYRRSSSFGGSEEPWVACWDGNIISEINDMKLYRPLWDVGIQLA